VAHLAATYPGLDFQPSDADEALHASIAAWSAGLDNVAPPLVLDVRTFPWPLARADVVLCVNMIHIAPWAAGAALIEGAAAILAPGGVLALYGPFRVAGRHTAPSNEAFDRSLRMQDPAWGVRDLDEVAAFAALRGFAAPAVTDMPTNNLTVVFRLSPQGR
jgi:SAM-dependent methyltransferase